MATLLAVLGIIIHIVTDTGTVKITGTDPSIIVRVDGGREIRIENLGEPITLRTGRTTQMSSGVTCGSRPRPFRSGAGRKRRWR